MKFDPVLLGQRMQEMKARGLWRDETVDDYIRRALAHCPDKEAVIAYSAGSEAPARLTYRELDKRVERISHALAALGVGHEDVVTFQLPNCWELIALALACVRIGAVANPVMPIFRQHELRFMLDLGESKVFIVPKSFREFDYEAMAYGMLPCLPHLEHLIVVGGDGENSFDAMLLEADVPQVKCAGTDPDDVTLLMYTSGTTGEPKGVMHTSNTLLAAIHAMIERLKLVESDVILGASPMAHLTGYGYLAMLPLILNATTVLQPIWNAHEALQIARDEGVTFSMASSAFVVDLCNAVESGDANAPSFKKFNCAGSPIPPVLIERARDLMGMRICSGWGMTETGEASATEPARAFEKSGVSDGYAMKGIELKVVDEAGNSLAACEVGRLLVRGASLFAGYFKRPQLNNVDADGWLDTGDLAFLDAEGYVRIVGRTKDIVIRGGENIPIAEIENLLYQHPMVLVAAVVGFPDERLGERVCAFVALKPRCTLTISELSCYLEKLGVAKQYWPERLEIVEDLPRTPSGKVQKFALREIAKKFSVLS